MILSLNGLKCSHVLIKSLSQIRCYCFVQIKHIFNTTHNSMNNNNNSNSDIGANSREYTPTTTTTTTDTQTNTGLNFTNQLQTELNERAIRQMMFRFRRFQRTKFYTNGNKNRFEFSVITYNILSQDLLENHRSLYEHCSQSSISWPQRGLRIVKELQESNADIICLQEVHSQHFNELIMPALKGKGYDYVFKKKTSNKCDGCAVLYKEHKFSLINTIKLELMRIDLSSVLDRDNIAIIVELKPKQLVNSDTKLIVANTHLLYNPRRGDVKVAQIRLLLAEIDKIALKSQTNGHMDYHPIILCGDMNSEPNSLLYNFIRGGFANFDGFKIGDISGQRKGFGKGRDVAHHHLELLGVTSDSKFESSSNNDIKKSEETKEKMSIKHNFKFRSVYPFVDMFNNKLISTSNYFESGLVDYIFYDCRNLRVLGFQQLLNKQQIERIGNIPNSYLGSDHLSLKAWFVLI